MPREKEMKKEKKLPNPTDIPLVIPNAKIEKKYNVKFNTKPITYIAETTTLEEFNKIHEMISATPFFFTPEERANDEIRQLRVKAKNMLNQPFSAGLAYKEFGTIKFPKKCQVECLKCSQKLEYVVDFFVHGILDHGNSFQHIEQVFQQVLDRIENKA